MESKFEPLNNDEVLFISRGRILMANPTFKVSELLDALAQLISEQEEVWSEETEGWFTDGLTCEVLRFGNQGWQRGRVRLRVEFCPDDRPKLLREGPRLPQEEGRRRAGRERPVREDIYGKPEGFFDDNFEADY